MDDNIVCESFGFATCADFFIGSMS